MVYNSEGTWYTIGCRVYVGCIGRPVLLITRTPSHAVGAGAPPLQVPPFYGNEELLGFRNKQ